MRWKGYILDGVGSSPPTIQTAGRATTLPDSHLKFGLGLVRKHLAGAEVISGRLQICTRTHEIQQQPTQKLRQIPYVCMVPWR